MTRTGWEDNAQPNKESQKSCVESATHSTSWQVFQSNKIIIISFNNEFNLILSTLQLQMIGEKEMAWKGADYKNLENTILWGLLLSAGQLPQKIEEA